MTQYTTTKGTAWAYPLSKYQWGRIKRAAASRFDGSSDLFNSCWRKYQREILPGTDNPENIADVMNWLDALAAEKVNDSASRFYIYG
jgi:hypothetical protein